MPALRMTRTRPPAGGRIWVALDQSPRSADALSAAAALASEFDAELAGLFVEDVNLQHLFGLPCSREFSLLTGAARPLSQLDVERSWRREAEALQRQLAEAAGRLSLRWSFRVARGRVSAEVNTLAQSFDLIVLGQRPETGVMAVARTTFRVAERRPAPRPGPVLALYESLPASARSLDMGAMLAHRNDAELVLLVSAANRDAYRAGCAAAQAALTEADASGRCVWLQALDGASLAMAAHREAAGCLVLAERERFLGQPGFGRLLEEIECPVVLAR